MMNSYFALSVDMVQSTYKDYLTDETLVKYYKGVLNMDSSYAYIPRQFQDTLDHEVVANSLITNIYFLSDEHTSITTTQTKEPGLYSAYIATSEGEQVAGDQYHYFLFGNRCDLDEKLKTDSSKYGVRLAKYFVNTRTVMLVDISKEVVESTLSSLEGGEGSIVGLVTGDGTEYLSSASQKPEEGTVFAGKDYFENIRSMEGEEALEGAFYVEEDKYLFLYTAVEGRNAYICALIPKETIVGQTREIQKLSVVLTVAACIVAVLMGLLLAGNTVYGSISYPFKHHHDLRIICWLSGKQNAYCFLCQLQKSSGHARALRKLPQGMIHGIAPRFCPVKMTCFPAIESQKLLMGNLLDPDCRIKILKNKLPIIPLIRNSLHGKRCR